MCISHGLCLSLLILSKQIEQHFPTVITGTGCCKEFDIGDLVWAKVGTYPWWPCMVSCDPQRKVHTRINTRGKTLTADHHHDDSLSVWCSYVQRQT